jgi:predicted glutamine amidotransferase
MCGIAGVLRGGSQGSFPNQALAGLFARLLLLSETRGKEACGMALCLHDSISVRKHATSAGKQLATSSYRGWLKSGMARAEREVALMGHARLATNGVPSEGHNNQPVVRDGIVMVHNGIVVNYEDLWVRYPQLERESEVDTEILVCLLQRNLSSGQELAAAVRGVYDEIRGVANIAAFLAQDDRLLLATNNGSLYLCRALEAGIVFFASEEFVIREAIRKEGLELALGPYTITQLRANHACAVCLTSLASHSWCLVQGQTDAPEPAESRAPAARTVSVISDASQGGPGPIRTVSSDLAREFESIREAVGRIRRCSRCVHPETLPFADFDSQGVCSYCRNHQPLVFLGREKLHRALEPHRRSDGRPDCIVPLSGGRDSCYSLHYLVKEMGMHPIAYTYDWGMVTDLARRNCSRICAELGLEHVIVSADIPKKRRFIRKNIQAWLKRPDLGTVPLFMAGDKQFFYYAEKLKQQTGLDLLIFAMNPLERTDFKHGFCGIEGGGASGLFFRLGGYQNFQIALYYARQYLTNPGYLNESLWDTLFAYFAYFLMPHRYTLFHDYIPWQEDVVINTLTTLYDWERDPETTSTWRIGDGTAPLYNYIYYTVAGFSENDTFRSYQIREGHLSREDALQLLEQENEPRFEALAWYCHVVGIDINDCLRVIHRIPRLY